MAANEVTIKVKANTRNAEQGAQRTNKAFKDLNSQMTKLAAGFGVGLGIGVIGKGLISTIGTFADFEQSIARAGAVSNATELELQRLSDAAREMGRTTQFSAAQAAEGLTFLSVAGFKVNESVAALPGVLQLAAAAQIDLGNAADIASNILSGFGLEVEDLARVNDILTKTFTTSNTSLIQLGEGMKFVGPVAEAAGISLEEVAAAMGILGNAGIQASMAGTSLRGIISRLLAPTGEAADILGRLNIEVMATDGSMLSLADIIGQLEKSTLTTAEALTIFGDRAGPAMLALLKEGGGALRDYTAEIDQVGITAEIATKQTDTLAGSFKRLGSVSQDAAIGIGKALPTRQAVDLTTDLINGITGLWQSTRTWDATIGKLLPKLREFQSVSKLTADTLEEESLLINALATHTAEAVGPFNDFGVSLSQLTELEGNTAAAARGVFAAIQNMEKAAKDAADILAGKLQDAIIDQAGATIEWEAAVKTLEGEMDELIVSILAQGGSIDFVTATLGQYTDKTITAEEAVGLLQQGLEAFTQSLKNNEREIENNISAMERLNTLAQKGVLSAAKSGKGLSPSITNLDTITNIFQKQFADPITGAGFDIGTDFRGLDLQTFLALITQLHEGGSPNAVMDAIRELAKLFDLEDIGVFHAGGVVPGAPGRETLARVLPGEGIFTQGQMSAMGGGGSGVTLVLNITNSQIGIADLDRHVLTLMRDARLSGRIDF